MKQRNRKIVTRLVTWILMCGLSFQAFAGSLSGQEIYQTACTHCHGDKSLGDESMQAPRLAGQNEAYLIEQLEHFRSGRRGHHSDDYNGQVMAAIAMTLNKRQIKLISQYLTSLDSKTLLVNEGYGFTLYRDTCAACHADNGEGSNYLFTPNLAILSDWYLHNQFNAYILGWRGSEEVGSTRSKGMRSIMGQVINEWQKEALIEYLTESK